MSVGAVNKQTGDRIPTAGMPAIDDALDLTSVNPVQNAIITAALANKQDKTDNNLETTAKTIVGAINEHEGDIDSLKSGLTNVDVALDVPEGTGKNLIPLTIDNLKAKNTNGTWTGNVYVDSGLTFTVNTDSDGDVVNITVTGTNSADSNYNFVLLTDSTENIRQLLNGKSLTLNGCPSGGDSATYNMFGYRITSTGGSIRDSGSGVDFEGVNTSQSFNLVIAIGKNYAIASSLVFTPMIRLSAITDPIFAPYIPSVESRIEAVESNLTGNWRQVTFADVFTFAQDVTASLGQNCVAWVRGDRVRIKLFVSGSITTTSTGYKTIGNVSNNYRPANNTIMPGFVNSRSDGTQMLASASYAINTNGNINLLYGDTATLGSVGSDWLGGNSILFEWSIK